MERLQQYFYNTITSMDGVEIKEEIIHQGPKQQTDSPTKDEVWEIIMETKHLGKKFIH
jgi:hypothetical protein